jgi:hypothetical protein
MNKKIFFISVFLCLFVSLKTYAAQNVRVSNKNAIGWYNYFGTFKFSKKLGLHTEYQFRRDDWVKNWQQSLLRVGLNYQIVPKLQFRAGYGWIETFSYGDIPINSMGKQFTEHRVFESITITDKVSILDITHRFMLEQRFSGKYSNGNLKKEDAFIYTNRMRYMYRMQIPLKGKSIVNSTPYLVVFDEIFIGFGKNVNENVFDQNRISVLLGYKLNDIFRLEGGYLNQIVQLGREVDNKNVFQYNNGIILNFFINVDLNKKENLSS